MDFQSARDNMIEKQIVVRGIHDARVIEAMSHVPRHEFVPVEARKNAYDDGCLSIGEKQTISQPYMVALMSQELELTKNHTVLEIGTGSGYQTAILAYLASYVHTIERFAELSVNAQRILRSLGFSNISFHVGDGTVGWPDKDITFDRIIITAASPTRLEHLFDSLNDNGKMVIPLGETKNLQQLTVFTKVSNKIEQKIICGCVFVPLVGEYGFGTN